VAFGHDWRGSEIILHLDTDNGNWSVWIRDEARMYLLTLGDQWKEVR
jgi:hypothetical protein